MNLPVFKGFDQILNFYEIKIVCLLFRTRIFCQYIRIRISSMQEIPVFIHIVPFFVHNVFVDSKRSTVIICRNAECIGCIYNTRIIDSQQAARLLGGRISGTCIAFI